MLDDSEMNFCPRCGQELHDREAHDHRLRPTCDNCDFVYFRDPKVAVVVFVTRDNKVLMVKRGMDPGLGKWALPAGFVDYGEDPREAAAREVEEETGVQVEISKLVDVLPGDTPGEGASIVIVYEAEMIGGKVSADDDVDEAGFFAFHEMPKIAFASTRLMIERWAKDSQPN